MYVCTDFKWNKKVKNIIIGVTGASGSQLAKTLLETTSKIDHVTTHLVLTQGAKTTLKYELKDENLKSLADFYYKNSNLAAPIASGTFKVDGMVIIPCSMKTIAALAHGFSQNLLLRAGDVCIKEKRKLILVPRETPLSQIHLQNLLTLSNIYNITILPPMLSFYHDPQCIEDISLHITGKILSFFDIDIDGFKRWK